MKQEKTDKINAALNGLLEQFKSGQIADTVTMAVFPPINGIPSQKWSLMNRVLMMMQGTSDARGYRQWQEAGRQVKKGSRAFHILRPRMVKAKEENGDENMRLIGFITIPVFRAEDTDGKPLEYENLPVPDLPLLDVAKTWGITVKAVSFQGGYYGSFSPEQRGSNEIRLATPEEKTFFHELSHAAHEKVLKTRGDTMKGGQNWKQEIVAELSAAVLCRLAGRSDKDTSGNSYRYIESNAQKAGKDALKGIASVIGDVEKVLARIMETAETLHQSPVDLVAVEKVEIPIADDLPGKWGILAELEAERQSANQSAP